MDESELDFGVMCDGPEFYDWQAECIGRLRELENVNLELLVVDDGDDAGKVQSFLEYRERRNTRDAIDRAAWHLYRLPFETARARRRTDLSDELRSVERIHCEVEEDGFSQYFHDDDLAEIREHDLDFVLRFAFGIVRGEILEIPEYGVWSFHHDDERKYRGSPPCFWELYNGDPVTGAILQRLTERLDGGVILKRGTFRTKRFSHRENLDNVFYGTTEWPAQVATDILNGIASYVDGQPAQTDAPIYRAPSPLQILAYNLKRGDALATAASKGIDHWNVGVMDASPEELVAGQSTPEIDWLPEPRGDGFVADPFPIEIDGTQYVFVEEFSYPEWKGRISFVEYPDGFEEGTVEPAIEEPFHMSYPYLFEHEGEVYATPEIYEANEVRLYRVNAPGDWAVETTLLDDVEAVDPTVVEHEGRWWLFLTDHEYSFTKLRVWHAPELTGPWEPHANNPVKTDVRSARPGGTPFVVDGDLYRPAQNSAEGYGTSIVVNRVDELTPTRYSETTVRELRPTDESQYPEGMHTLAARGGITLVDGRRHLWSEHTARRRVDQLLSMVRS